MTPPRVRSDEAVSTVVGALVVLAVLGVSLVYVNAFHVPEQGAAMEVAARDDAEAELRGLAADLSSPASGPLLADVPLRGEPADPPLLGGIVLSPVRAAGRLAFEPAQANLTLSHVTVAPAEGVPAGDPMRAALPGGLVRVWSLGNATQGVSLGALRLDAGAAYLEPATYSLEGGAVVVKRAGGSALAAPPSLRVSAGGTPGFPTTVVSWRVPLLAGAPAEVSGGERAQVGLSPGPAASSGGGQLVQNVTILVQTDALAAWRAALEDLVGGRGTVTSVATGPDRGTVTATILPPPGTPVGRAAVELDLHAVRYAVQVAERGGG